jgi:hypothetical protein
MVQQRYTSRRKDGEASLQNHEQNTRGRDGFNLVLGATAVIALIANGVEKQKARAVQPAE